MGKDVVRGLGFYGEPLLSSVWKVLTLVVVIFGLGVMVGERMCGK